MEAQCNPTDALLSIEGGCQSGLYEVLQRVTSISPSRWVKGVAAPSLTDRLRRIQVLAAWLFPAP